MSAPASLKLSGWQRWTTRHPAQALESPWRWRSHQLPLSEYPPSLTRKPRRPQLEMTLQTVILPSPWCCRATCPPGAIDVNASLIPTSSRPGRRAGNQVRGTETVARQISRGAANHATGAPAVRQLSSDLIEKPEDWLGGTKENAKEERNKTDNAARNPEPANSVAAVNIDTQSITELADQILNRFPLAAPTVLLFAGSEWNPHIDETCAQVAYQLAQPPCRQSAFGGFGI